MAKQWFDIGYDGINREEDRIARQHGPSRLWLKEGTSREIVFVDDEAFCIKEHNWKANGSWRNWITCIRDVHDAVPCCEKLGDRSASYIGFYTVVDCTEHKDAKGNSYQYELKLFPAKMKTLKVLRRKKNDRGSLVGATFKVTRDTADDPNCGNDFDYMKDADLEKLFKVANYKGKKLPELYKEASEKPDLMKRLRDTFQLPADGALPAKIAPFNYMNLLAPREPREIRQILGSYTPESPDGGGSSSGPKDDEIPF